MLNRYLLLTLTGILNFYFSSIGAVITHASPTHLQIQTNLLSQNEPDIQIQIILDDLTHYIQKQALPLMPDHFKQVIESKLLYLNFTPDCPSDAYFYADQSNQNQIILCLQPTLLRSADLKSLVVHEVFHAAQFYIHPDEPVWIREGLAQWFEYHVSGRFNAAGVEAALTHSQTALTLWKGTSENYGHAFLYFYYLEKQCGGPELIWKLAQGDSKNINLVGSKLISKILEQNNSPLKQCTSFEESALHFELARVHNKIFRHNQKLHTEFYLMSTALKMKPFNAVLTKNLLNELHPFQPLIVSSHSKLPDEVKNKKFKLYYLQTQYPYQVSEEPLKNSLVVVIKTH